MLLPKLDGGPFGFVRDLAVLCLVCVSAATAGRWCLKRWAPDARKDQFHLALSFGQASLYQYAGVVLLAVAQVLVLPALIALVALPLVASPRAAVGVLRSVTPRLHPPRYPTVTTVLTILLLLCYGLLSLSPPGFVDEASYHLAIPREWLAYRGVPSDTGNFYSLFPPAMSS